MTSFADILYSFKRSTHSWTNPKTKAQSSMIHGKGRFALEDLAAGDVVAVVGGFIVDLQQESLVSGLQVSERFGIRGSFLHRKNSCINHSCSPNCVISGDIFIVTSGSIRAGEELTLDYGGFLFSEGKRTVITNCLCQSPDCRKMITTHDWKSLPTSKLNRYLKGLRDGS